MFINVKLLTKEFAKSVSIADPEISEVGSMQEMSFSSNVSDVLQYSFNVFQSAFDVFDEETRKIIKNAGFSGYNH